jgi:hypothetical protein
VLEGEPIGPTSLKAVALDTGGHPTIAREPSVEQPVARPVPLRFKLIVGSVIAVCLVILCIGGIRFAVDRANAPAAAAAISTPEPPPIANTIAKPEPPPVATVAAPAPIPKPSPEPIATAPKPEKEALKPPPPAAKTATLKLSHAGKPLTVDGKKVTGASAVVTCGSHMVAVGKDKPHRVDAPCGSTVVVDAPQKAKGAKPRP